MKKFIIALVALLITCTMSKWIIRISDIMLLHSC